MDFALSDEQQQFAASLHDMLAAADGPAVARCWAAGDRKPGLAVWRALAEAGVTGLMVAPEHGGLGAGPVDLVIACEEIGHHAVPGPVAESVAAVPQLLTGKGVVGYLPPHDRRCRANHAPSDPGGGAEQLAGGWPEQLAAGGPEQLAGGWPEQLASGWPEQLVSGWLEQLASGELIATLAAPPWLPFAADADAAGLVLLAEPGSVRLGVVRQCHQSVEAARTLSEVTGGDPVATGPQVAGPMARALELGTLACAAQLLGAGRALLEATAAHARQRIQFGLPVGSFQAVKHHLANVLIGLEFARPLLFGAAISLSAGSADTARDVSAAKVACADAASLAARIALQVHGAIGYTAEHDVSLWLTKVRALGPSWGSQAEHRARVLAAVAGPDS
jgi:alkylation response protein AidB-like acyl-CoA dehydrogenase